MQEVQFELRRTHFLGERVDLDVLRLAVLVNIVDERVEIIHRVDAVRLVGRLGPAEPAFRRFDLLIDIGMCVDQVRITSYNVCYTKLLGVRSPAPDRAVPSR